MSRSVFHTFLQLTLVTLLLIPSHYARAETLTIAGTGDSQRLLRQLAIDFHRLDPATQILVPNSVGSSGGIKLLESGRSDLARVARPLTTKEQGRGLQLRLFAYSPIVFVANLPAPCLKSITANEARDIFHGRITSWSELGSCFEHKIYVIHREQGDSSRTVLEREIPELSAASEPAGRTLFSTPETYDTLNQYQHTFGYLPKAQLQKGTLTILDFEGISPSVENVQQGRYPLVVPLAIAWKGELTEPEKRFIDFLFSETAQQRMRELGAVPVLQGG